MRYKSFLVLLGLVYYETGRYWDTICLLSEAIDIFALDGESWLYRSLSYFHLKEYQEALRDANTCIKINGKSWKNIRVNKCRYFYLPSKTISTTWNGAEGKRGLFSCNKNKPRT